VDVQEVGGGRGDWMELAQDRDRWRALEYSETSVHERPCSRTIRFTNKFSEQKPSRMTNGVSDYKHASWQQRQAESISAGVSVAG
jgi:hypothetical protein